VPADFIGAGVRGDDPWFRDERSAPLRATLEVLRRAFEEGGVEFTNGERPGVRLGKAES
jgi:hypothetical protein